MDYLNWWETPLSHRRKWWRPMRLKKQNENEKTKIIGKK
jgi:hypothetical protein